MASGPNAFVFLCDNMDQTLAVVLVAMNWIVAGRKHLGGFLLVSEILTASDTDLVCDYDLSCVKVNNEQIGCVLGSLQQDLREGKQKTQLEGIQMLRKACRTNSSPVNLNKTHKSKAPSWQKNSSFQLDSFLTSLLKCQDHDSTLLAILSSPSRFLISQLTQKTLVSILYAMLTLDSAHW